MVIEEEDDDPNSEAYHIDMVDHFLREHPNPNVKMIEDFAPEKWVDDWKKFLRKDWEYKLKIFRKCGNANIEGLEDVDVKNMGARHVGMPVELEPMRVVGISQNEFESVQVRMKCVTCGEEFVFPPHYTLEPRQKLCDCSIPRLVDATDGRDLIDVQWIKLEEIKRNRKLSKVPLSIPALLKGEGMMWSVKFNERIRPIGFVRYRTVKDRRTGAKHRLPWFEIYGIKKVRAEEYDVMLSDGDIEYIKSEMAKPGFFQKLLKSFCPYISGMEALKECALLVLASVKLKRTARITIIGDPSMGKSEVMIYASNILPDSYYVVMSSARRTGLTVTSQKNPDGDSWMVEPGAFAAADGSAMFIDEFQQGEEHDITSLNYVVEHGKIPYALAGGNIGEFEANPALMISANAHGGMIGSEQNIHELLKFIGKGLPAYLARQNLVLIIKDQAEYSEENQIAHQMYQNAELDPAAKYDEDWWVMDEGNEERIYYYGTKTIRKIIKYVIERVKVEGMPEELEDMFIDYYMKKWSDPLERVNKLINRRFARHSIVLAQYFARLQGRSKPTESDALHVFELLEKHLSVAAFDPKTQEIDAGMLNVNRSKREIRSMDEQSEVRNEIDKYMGERNPEGNRIHLFFTCYIIAERLWYSDPARWSDSDSKPNESKVRKIVDMFLKHRQLYETGAEGSGRYVPVW